MKSCWRKTVFLLPAAVSFAFASQRKENPQRRDVFAGVPFLLWGVRVSARGFGKFVYDGQTATSKKGRCLVRLRLYK